MRAKAYIYADVNVAAPFVAAGEQHDLTRALHARGYRNVTTWRPNFGDVGDLLVYSNGQGHYVTFGIYDTQEGGQTPEAMSPFAISKALRQLNTPAWRKAVQR